MIKICGVALAILWSTTQALAESLPVDPEEYYAVTLEVSTFELETVKPTKIIGIETMGHKKF